MCHPHQLFLTRKLLWQHKLAFPPSTFLWATHNVLYIAWLTNTGGAVAALRGSDGSLLWQRKVNTHDLRYYPMIADGVLYFGLNDGSIEAWRGSDGSFLWHYTATSSIFWYPRAVDGIMYIRQMNGTMDALQMSTGVVLWRYPANK